MSEENQVTTNIFTDGLPNEAPTTNVTDETKIATDNPSTINSISDVATPITNAVVLFTKKELEAKTVEELKTILENSNEVIKEYVEVIQEIIAKKIALAEEDAKAELKAKIDDAKQILIKAKEELEAEEKEATNALWSFIKAKFIDIIVVALLIYSIYNKL